MIKAVIDEVVPSDFTKLFLESDVEVAAFPDALRGLSDGELISQIIYLGFHWLVTCDKQMPFQQNLRAKPLSIMVLPTPKVVELEPINSAILAALRQPVPGHFLLLDARGDPAAKPTPHAIGRNIKSS